MLRDGITHEDWELIKDAYRVMGGVLPEDKPKPQPKKRSKSKIKKEKPELELAEVASVPSKSSRTIQKGQKPTFVDDKTVGRGPDYETPDVDKSLRSKRGSFEKVKVKCAFCGHEEYVAPIFAGVEGSRYRCNKCY